MGVAWHAQHAAVVAAHKLFPWASDAAAARQGHEFSGSWRAAQCAWQRSVCPLACMPQAIAAGGVRGAHPPQVVRLPSLRSRIAAWRAERGLEPLPPLDPAPGEVLAAGRGLARLLADLRCGDAYRRGLAAGALNDLLIRWGPQPTQQQAAVMEVRPAAPRRQLMWRHAVAHAVAHPRRIPLSRPGWAPRFAAPASCVHAGLTPCSPCFPHAPRAAWSRPSCWTLCGCCARGTPLAAGWRRRRWLRCPMRRPAVQRPAEHCGF